MEVNSPQPEQNNIPVPNQPVIPEIPQEPSSRILLYGGIAFVVVVLVGIAVFLYSINAKKQLTNSINVQPTSLPTVQANKPVLSPISTPSAQEPLTAKNTDQTLSTTDSNIQQSLNQVDIDLKDLNNVDTTQDNPNNL